MIFFSTLICLKNWRDYFVLKSDIEIAYNLYLPPATGGNLYCRLQVISDTDYHFKLVRKTWSNLYNRLNASVTSQ